jgi:broad specificity phosphatase PhoE
MKARFSWFLLLFLVSTGAIAQSEALTTFILIRHAEKEGQNTMSSSNKDPRLSAEGLNRATRLTELFSKTAIDAIYSTPFVRTKSTVTPLAQSKSLPVFEYEPNKIEAIDKMIVDHLGKTIVICGHSNTIPKIANQLTKSGSFKDFDDVDYGNILIITVSSTSKSANVIWLRY